MRGSGLLQGNRLQSAGLRVVPVQDFFATRMAQNFLQKKENGGLLNASDASVNFVVTN